MFLGPNIACTHLCCPEVVDEFFYSFIIQGKPANLLVPEEWNFSVLKVGTARLIDLSCKTSDFPVLCALQGQGSVSQQCELLIWYCLGRVHFMLGFGSPSPALQKIF